MAEIIQYREPVFTFDNAKKGWGKAFWSISGQKMLDWIKAGQVKMRGLGAQSWMDYRPTIALNPIRRICWCMYPKIGEIPDSIVESYTYPIEEFPGWLPAEGIEEYLLRKSWSHLYFKWDTMSIKPHEFSLLLAKMLAASDYNKVGLVILDTKDLYVNFNPVEWCKKYDAEYPSGDLDKQKILYDQWLTWSGFKRYYIFDKATGKLVATPWYYRTPIEGSPYGSTIKEFPEYVPHPLKVTGGIFYPDGYEGIKTS